MRPSTRLRRKLAADSNDYVRFIVLGHARTGSTMLVQALNSSPDITCFGELFHWQVDFVDFNVAGYDNDSTDDRALRDRDWEQFLRERIFCRHPKRIKAVGFKLLYSHVWGFAGLLERLIEDTQIRVLHLRRRNWLRSLVSLKTAEMTGTWHSHPELSLAHAFTPANALNAVRHPFKALDALRRRLRRPPSPNETARGRVTISVEECSKFFMRTQWEIAHFEDMFREHPTLPVLYEDILRDRTKVFSQMQAFLGVRPQQLTVTLRRQNPEPLRELIENYDELYGALKDTPQAAFFD